MVRLIELGSRKKDILKLKPLKLEKYIMWEDIRGYIGFIYKFPDQELVFLQALKRLDTLPPERVENRNCSVK